MTIRAKTLIDRAVSQISPPLSAAESSVTLALSGGVDSSVAGLLLRERGWKVQPVLFRCWDDSDDEKEGSSCFEAELRAAEQSVKALDIAPLQVYNFVREYWTEVFDGVFLSGLQNGSTPNPDLACNRAVKFGAFPERLAAEGKRRFATGHYARVRDRNGLPELLAAKDARKDQSYFLASVRGSRLKHAMFPVGALLKSEVRTIAQEAGLAAAHARSSRGICFVGKRRMAPFLERYLAGGAGNFVDVDSGMVVGALDRPAHAFTTGQRARIGGRAQALYVVGKRGCDVIVARGCSHQRLFTEEIVCARVDWISGVEADGVDEGVWLECKTCSTADRMTCLVIARGDGRVDIRFNQRVRRVAAGQAVVLYDGDVCLGAAWPLDDRAGINVPVEVGDEQETSLY